MWVMVMRIQRLSLFVVSLAVLVIGSSSGAERGDASAGRDLVNRSCVSCHATDDTTRVSDASPTLSFLAHKNKSNGSFVRAWLTEPHPPMAGISLSRQQVSDIIAYLETLSGSTGDAVSGKRLAEIQCAGCHGVDPSEHSRNSAAPTFADIAESPGLTASAIRVWLQSPHPTIPNIRLHDEDKDNVIAYLLSLKKSG
jgi:mono/diheme cytochrome c family protein